MVKTTVYIDDEVKRQLGQKARRVGRSEASLIREALADAVSGEKEEWQLPQSIGVVADGSEPAADAKRRLRKQWLQQSRQS